MNASLLTISVIAVLLPAAFSWSQPNQDTTATHALILKMSHGVRLSTLG